ncbi:hypothetical protein PG987_013353 [Apiospora arundinis]
MEMQFPPPVNPDNLGRGPMIKGITWTFTIIAMIAVGLRLRVRWTLSKSWALEDWIMLSAAAFVVVHQALATIAYTYGMGKHDADIEQPHSFVEILKWIWISVAPGMLVSILARVSITLLLVRLFGGVYRSFKWCIIILTSFTVLFCGLLIPFTYLQVTPVDGLWKLYSPVVSRWDPRIVLYMQYIGQWNATALYTLSDIVYVFWPVLIVWKLQMPARRKIGLVMMLAGSLHRGNINSEDNHCSGRLGVQWSILEEDFVITMGCVKSILVGEGIMISYDTTLPSGPRRLKLKNSIGFQCCCELCTLPTKELAMSDGRRFQIKNLDSMIFLAATWICHT